MHAEGSQFHSFKKVLTGWGHDGRRRTGVSLLPLDLQGLHGASACGLGGQAPEPGDAYSSAAARLALPASPASTPAFASQVQRFPRRYVEAAEYGRRGEAADAEAASVRLCPPTPGQVLLGRGCQPACALRSLLRAVPESGRPRASRACPGLA